MKVCRHCGKLCKGSVYSLERLSDIIRDAYNVDVGKDDDAIFGRKVCINCYKILKRWNSDYEKHNRFIKKNPNSPKVFSSGVQLLEDIDHHPVVHLASGCPCGYEGLLDLYPAGSRRPTPPRQLYGGRGAAAVVHRQEAGQEHGGDGSIEPGGVPAQHVTDVPDTPRRSRPGGSRRRATDVSVNQAREESQHGPGHADEVQAEQVG